MYTNGISMYYIKYFMHLPVILNKGNVQFNQQNTRPCVYTGSEHRPSLSHQIWLVYTIYGFMY